jgi:uncharacterized membrane protein YccC
VSTRLGMKRWLAALQARDPNQRALRKAGRTAVVMSVGFLFGIHIVHNAQFAVIATFTGAALLGIADFGGSRRQRVRVTAITAVIGALLLAIGTAVSTNTAAATATMFVVTLVVGFTAVFSGYFAAGSSAVIVFYVVATGVQGPMSVIPSREAGLALGGVLSVLAAGWLWPSRSTTECRGCLGSVYRQLAEQIGDLTSDRRPSGSAPSAERARHLAESILDAERSIARSAWRPDGLASPHKARMYMLQGARRMASLIAAFDTIDGPTTDQWVERSSRLTTALARELELCAVGLESDGRELPDPEPVEAAKREFGLAADRHFADLAADGRPVDELGDFAAWLFVLQQLSWGVVLASVHCRVIYGASLAASPVSERSPLVQVLTDGPWMAKWIRRARRNLTFRSVHLQNSLRLATGLALARLAVGEFDLQHGFWVGFATLVVLKTSASGTRSTVVQAVVGTTIGFGVSTVLITSFGVDALVYSILLPVVVFAAFYLPSTISFVAGQTFFTLVIVVLFNLLKPSGWSVGLVRLEDVLIGAIIGLVIGVAIWPRGASAELARVSGRLIEAGGTYATATIGHLVEGDGDAGAAPEVGAQPLDGQVGVAAVEAEDVFSQYLGEPHQSNAPVMAWASVMAAAHQLWFGVSVVVLTPVATGARSTMPELRREILASSARLEMTCRSVAAALVDQGRLSVERPVPFTGTIDRSTPIPSLTMLELEAWLGELADQIAALGPSIEVLSPRGRPRSKVAPVPVAD